MKKEIRYEIHWQDAFSCDRWETQEWLKDRLKSGNPIITIGFLLGQNKDWIAIGGTLDGKEQCANCWFIPKKWIIKTKKLK